MMQEGYLGGGAQATQQTSRDNTPSSDTTLDLTPLASPVSPWVPSGLHASLDGANPEDDVVTIQDSSSSRGKEIYVSCLDVCGLGCLLARTIADFGLRIISTDYSTDGRYCFNMYRVEPAPASRAGKLDIVDWHALKTTLEELCPSGTSGSLRYQPCFDATTRWRRANDANKGATYHALRVRCRNRIGLIHWLICTFWQYRVIVHHLKCVTTPDDEADDEFTVSEMSPAAQEGAAEGSLGSGRRTNLDALCACIREGLDATVTLAPCALSEKCRKNRPTSALHFDHVAEGVPMFFQGRGPGGAASIDLMYVQEIE